MLHLAMVSGMGPKSLNKPVLTGGLFLQASRGSAPGCSCLACKAHTQLQCLVTAVYLVCHRLLQPNAAYVPGQYGPVDGAKAPSLHRTHWLSRPHALPLSSEAHNLDPFALLLRWSFLLSPISCRQARLRSLCPDPVASSWRAGCTLNRVPTRRARR